jgi:hypothetical protein
MELETPSSDGSWRAAKKSGWVYSLQHGEEATAATVKWMNGAWDQKRDAELVFWREHVFPVLYQAWKNNTMAELCESKPGCRSFMEVALQILDNIFFGGYLAAHCTVKWDDTNPDELAYTKQIQLGEILIGVSRTVTGDEYEMIESLLHELCHAHEFLWTCDSGQLCSGACGALSGRYEPSLHPHCFFVLSQQVEKLATTVFARDISIGRDTAYIDMCDKHNVIPETLYIHEYFSREEDFEGMMKYREEKLQNYPEAGIESMN